MGLQLDPQTQAQMARNLTRGTSTVIGGRELTLGHPEQVNRLNSLLQQTGQATLSAEDLARSEAARIARETAARNARNSLISESIKKVSKVAAAGAKVLGSFVAIGAELALADPFDETKEDQALAQVKANLASSQQALETGFNPVSLGAGVTISDPLPNSPKMSEFPVANNQPTNLYNQPTFPGFQGFSNQPITTAEQQAVLTAPKTIQVVDVSSHQRKYGTLLHEPVSNETVVVKKVDTTNFNREFEKNQEAASKTITGWMNHDEEATGKTHEEAFPDFNIGMQGMVFITPAGSTTPKIIWGQGALAEFYGQLDKRAKITTPQPVRTAVPTNVLLSPVPLVAALLTPRNIGAIRTGLGTAGSNIWNRLRSPAGCSLLGDQMRRMQRSIDIGSFWDAIALALTLHNAMMLSTDIVRSCGAIIDNVLNIIGVTNPDSQSTTQVASQWFQNLIISVIGKKNYLTIRKRFQLLSAIYTAATNLMNTLSSIIYSLISIVEIMGNYIAKIGNALIKFGVVGERAYGWMSEGLSARAVKLVALTAVLVGAGQIASDLEIITGEGVSIKDAAIQSKEDKKALDKAVADGKEEFFPDNKVLKDKADLSKTNTATVTPEPTLKDIEKPDPI